MLKVPVDGLSVRLVELSPALCDIQEQTLTGTTHAVQPSLNLPPEHEGPYKSCELPSGASVSWYRELNEVPKGIIPSTFICSCCYLYFIYMGIVTSLG